jgi:hypothetical protein
LSKPFCAISRFTTASFPSQHWHPEHPCRQ